MAFIKIKLVPLVVLTLLLLLLHPGAAQNQLGGVTRAPGADLLEPPEGYYAFEEAPNAEPPRVRRPPYLQTDMPCAGLGNVQPHMSINNLCGDLNKGYIPKNPMTNSLESSYPFELIKNMTLNFFSTTLPILKADDALPKVARYQQTQQQQPQQQQQYYFQRPAAGASSSQSPVLHRDRRAAAEPSHETQVAEEAAHGASPRQGRKFCDNGGGMLCMLYKAFRGEPLASGLGVGVERRDEVGDAPEYRRDPGSSPNALPQDASPPTPCPAKVEYATPVFAKNYQGVWRYVVQIPYEGYFTQTLEVTRCLNSKCHYLDGSCMSSPRWVSLLVAELYYPDSHFPSKGQQWPARRPVATEKPPPVHDFQNYQQYLQKRAGQGGEQSSPSSRILGGASSSGVNVVTGISSSVNALMSSGISLAVQETTTETSTTPSYCDGVDTLGCFQVRLYYDWFLIPGSCKCWRPDYFARYNRKRVSRAPDL